MQKRIRTNIYPSKPKNGVRKDCEGKGVFLLLNPCDESQTRISTVSKNKKGEPLIAVACAGCGRTQLLRERRVVLCDGYTCGFGGHCAKNPRFVLPAVPDRCVRNTRFANPEEIEAIARARDVVIRPQTKSR